MTEHAKDSVVARPRPRTCIVEQAIDRSVR